MSPAEYFGVPAPKPHKVAIAAKKGPRKRVPKKIRLDALPYIGLGMAIIAGIRSGFYVFGFFAEFEPALPSLAMAVLIVSGSTIFPNLARWYKGLGVIILAFSMAMTLSGIWEGRYKDTAQEVAVSESVNQLAEARVAEADARETLRLLRAGMEVLEPGTWQYAGQYRRTVDAETKVDELTRIIRELSADVVASTPPDTVFTFAGRALGLDYRLLELLTIALPALILDLVGVVGFGLWYKRGKDGTH